MGHITIPQPYDRPRFPASQWILRMIKAMLRSDRKTGFALRNQQVTLNPTQGFQGFKQQEHGGEVEPCGTTIQIRWKDMLQGSLCCPTRPTPSE